MLPKLIKAPPGASKGLGVGAFPGGLAGGPVRGGAAPKGPPQSTESTFIALLDRVFL